MFVCVRPKTTYEQAVTTDYSTLVVLTGAQRNIHIYVIFVPATLLVCGIRDHGSLYLSCVRTSNRAIYYLVEGSFGLFLGHTQHPGGKVGKTTHNLVSKEANGLDGW